MTDQPTDYCEYVKAHAPQSIGDYGWLVQTFTAFKSGDKSSELSDKAAKYAHSLTPRIGKQDLVALATISDEQKRWMPLTEEDALALARHLIAAVRANRARGS
jgi:hypothetical protein